MFKQLFKFSSGFLDESLLSKEELIKYKLAMVKATTGYDLARRLIGVGWTYTTLLMAFITFLLVIFGVDTSDEAAQFLIDFMLNPTMVVMVFYFGPGLIGKFSKSKTKES